MPSTATVTFASDVGSAKGHAVRPGKGVPGVIVLQEWWGLVPHIKDVAVRFAAQGYLALAPDLYEGKSTLDAAEAQRFAEEMELEDAVKKVTGAVRYLRDVEGATRVGVVGFGVGGALAILAAAQPGVDAYVAFYGFPPRGAGPLETIAAPGLIFFGDEEPYFSMSDARAFVEAQKTRDGAVELIVYPGAGHGFFNETLTDTYREAAANYAWRRTLEHFGRHLRFG